uniref:Kazal-like domain-containing protein n=2 Tax=Clastoptera arizonana TaxID=38151 RepID=A0A1B6DLK0_9HEMI
MDWRRMPDASAEQLCSILSPADPHTPCISLKPFMEPSDRPYNALTDQVTQPCKGSPCNSTHVCTINRFRQHSRMYPTYTCSLGCKLGVVSQYIVPSGSYVRIPVATGHKGCLQICQCSSSGQIEQCQPMPCFPLESCWIAGKKIEHSTVYYMECRMCSCYAGETTCSKKQCEMSAPGMRDHSYTSLPCNCPPHFVPVCARTGQTYPNSCLAKCANLNDADFVFGTCEASDPCKNDPCNDGEVCVPAKKVCLSLLHSPCQQFQCVSMRDNCRNFPDEPVCSTDRHHYHNICELVHEGKTLDYYGPCLNGCNRTGLVCGVDGNTYSSECSAWARYVQVDYPGICKAVGLIKDRPEQQCSDLDIECPPLTIPGCIGVTPPGACCPVCAGALRVLYSQKQIDRALYALRGKAHGNTDKHNNKINALTLNTILKALDRQVQVAECTVRGYLTVEVDIVVLVVPIGNQVSDLQLESCVREAEKLQSLIQRFSPRMISELSLSSLIAATVIHEVIPDSASAIAQHALAPALFLLLRWLS